MSNTDVSAEAGNGSVKVICDGKGIFKSIKISAEAINSENPSSVSQDDIEMLEDLIVAATNEALRMMEADSAKAMEALTGGLNLGGGFPF